MGGAKEQIEVRYYVTGRQLKKVGLWRQERPLHRDGQKRLPSYVQSHKGPQMG